MSNLPRPKTAKIDLRVDRKWRRKSLNRLDSDSEMAPARASVGLASERLRRQNDFAKPKPARHHGKLLGDRIHDVRGGVRLEMDCVDKQSSALAVSLQVEPGHEPIAEQEGRT
jgi:hypothetical protein